MEIRHYIRVPRLLLALFLIIGLAVAVGVIVFASRAEGSKSRESLPSWKIEKARIVPNVSPNVKAQALFTSGAAIRGWKKVDLVDRVETCNFGSLTPSAVISPDGATIAYNVRKELRIVDRLKSYDEQGIETGDPLYIPNIRLHDLKNGTDVLFAEGACGVAWRSDGAIAYVKGSKERRAEAPYLGSILFRASLSTKPEVWTAEPGDYAVIGWAGNTLLAYKDAGDETESYYLAALDGKGQERVLSYGNLLAISPDGSKVFVAPDSDEAEQALGAPVEAKVIEVSSNRVVASIPILKQTLSGLEGLLLYHLGDWSGNTVIGSGYQMTPDRPVLVAFEVSDDSIEVKDVLTFDTEAIVGLPEPRFSSISKDLVYVTAIRDESTAIGSDFVRILVCDLEQTSCSKIQEESAEGRLRQVYNPSRPMQNGN